MIIFLVILVLWFVLGGLLFVTHTRKEAENEQVFPMPWWKIILSIPFVMVAGIIFLLLPYIGRLFGTR